MYIIFSCRRLGLEISLSWTTFQLIKTKQAISMIESVGAEVWFLPPYSPDLNPIEKMWSKVKQFLRSAKARTRDALLKAITDALACLSAQDAAGCLNPVATGALYVKML